MTFSEIKITKFENSHCHRQKTFVPLNMKIMMKVESVC